MMSTKSEPLVLMADDDEDDRLLMQDAFRRNKFERALHFVEDGEQLLDYLRRRGPWADAPRPDLILLDLNMPRKDGREALREIKADPELRSIPVVVMTTSRAEADVQGSYEAGANSFIAKPANFESLQEVTRYLRDYWFKLVELPR